ncbi:MAG: Pyruvate:ferredoxin oxidoreductase delta subunit PorD [Candidatus Methanohalarchaeum thermophilum]|uniref:Pyruvate:ferredoxin oxidoreductase delta subunit PorD n=1 Tax=Methanohalarchaeum thermophilum TaxID=1903181 RepID=A0A1Q6DTF3_METT1|nr:MAG: Pyruvate:ferredoxin oxidoreductase delta subunit PorD [Candidatus Methanohalarchaeum thermophilum]
MVNFAGIAEPGSTKNYKTGTWRTYRPVVDFDKCIGCAKCWEYCPEGCIIELEVDGKEVYETDLDYCKGCGICSEECPVGAIEMELEEED